MQKIEGIFFSIVIYGVMVLAASETAVFFLTGVENGAGLVLYKKRISLTNFLI